MYLYIEIHFVCFGGLPLCATLAKQAYYTQSDNSECLFLFENEFFAVMMTV